MPRWARLRCCWPRERPLDGRAAAADPAARPRGAWPVYVAIGLSGLTALGAEVVWTRILSLLFGATVYTFSLITAAFLAGLGIGSSVGAWIARDTKRPGVLLAACQVGVIVTVAWAALLITRAFPYWPIDPALAAGPWFNFQIDLLRAVISIVPAAFFWGASFPLALSAVASRTQDPGRVVGPVYAANTVGAIVGALAFSLLIIPGVGTQDAQRWMIGISAIGAVVMLVWRSPADAPLGGARRIGALIAAVVLAVIAAATVAPVPPDLIAYGRQIATFKGATYLYEGEGLNSSIAVSELEGGIRNFHVSGKVEASTEVHDMRLQRLLGHMSALMHPEPRSVLVVGFGAGVTAGSFVLHPGVKRIVICEIEPLIPRMVAPYFSKENYDVLHDPRVEVVYDDARHYILTTHEKFDVITSDPIHPWVKGAASLYTKDYFELVKAHLNPGGVVTQWVPLYQSTTDVVKSEIGDVLRRLPVRHHLEQSVRERRRLRRGDAGQAGAADIDPGRCRRGSIVRITPRLPRRSRKWSCRGPSASWPRTRDRPGICANGWPTRRSTAIRTCGWSTWPEWATTCTTPASTRRCSRTDGFPRTCSPGPTHGRIRCGRR